MKGDESHAGGGPTTIVAAGNQPIPPQPTIPVDPDPRQPTDTPVTRDSRQPAHQRSANTPASSTTRHNPGTTGTISDTPATIPVQEHGTRAISLAAFRCDTPISICMSHGS